MDGSHSCFKDTAYATSIKFVNFPEVSLQKPLLLSTSIFLSKFGVSMHIFSTCASLKRMIESVDTHQNVLPSLAVDSEHSTVSSIQFSKERHLKNWLSRYGMLWSLFCGNYCHSNLLFCITIRATMEKTQPNVQIRGGDSIPEPWWECSITGEKLTMTPWLRNYDQEELIMLQTFPLLWPVPSTNSK